MSYAMYKYRCKYKCIEVYEYIHIVLVGYCYKCLDLSNMEAWETDNMNLSFLSCCWNMMPTVILERWDGLGEGIQREAGTCGLGWNLTKWVGTHETSSSSPNSYL